MLQIIATSLDGTVLGEVTKADNRKVSLPHLRLPSASFSVPLNHYLAGSLLDGDCLIRVYNYSPAGNKNLIFHGPIVSSEEVGESLKQTVSVNAAGAFWRLSKRIIPGSDQKSGFSLSSRDLGQMAHDILTTCNGASNGYTGIVPGSLTASLTGAIDRWYMKNAAEAIAELSAAIGSFEFVVEPEEASSSAFAWPRIGRLDVAPMIGSSRPDVIFEYGTTRANVASYSRRVDREGLLTRALISVNGWPDLAAKNVLTSTAAEAATRGLFEELIPDGGIEDDAIRQSVADYHVLVRKQPRQVITFKPAVNAKPYPFVDYDVGDFVRARAVVSGSVRFDAQFRIWGISLEVDKNGNDNVELQLVPDA